METFIERLVCTNSRCFTCGALVYAVEKKKTTNHIYHNRCFRCRICKRSLNGLLLNEDGDDIYCTNCYRKKQRGDCNGIDFQRAAKERAQFVYNRQHPDQPPLMENPHRPIQRDLSRQPSRTLRQLERQFLSHQGDKSNDVKKNNEYERRIVSDSHSKLINTTFFFPTNSTDFRSISSKTTESLSPSLHFLPVFSPLPTPGFHSKTSPTAKVPDLFNREKSISSDKIPFQFKRYSLDLTSSKAKPPLIKTYSLITDINEKTDNDKEKKSTKVFFPERIITSPRRRSSSISYSINSRKIK